MPPSLAKKFVVLLMFAALGVGVVVLDPFVVGKGNAVQEGRRINKKMNKFKNAFIHKHICINKKIQMFMNEPIFKFVHNFLIYNLCAALRVQHTENIFLGY